MVTFDKFYSVKMNKKKKIEDKKYIMCRTFLLFILWILDLIFSV